MGYQTAQSSAGGPPARPIVQRDDLIPPLARLPDRGVLVGLLRVGGLAGRLRRARKLPRLVLLELVVIVLALERGLEVPNSLAERSPELGNPPRPEHERHDDEDDHDFEGADVWHTRTLARPGGGHVLATNVRRRGAASA